jgi:hypothetical protein
MTSLASQIGKIFRPLFKVNGSINGQLDYNLIQTLTEEQLLAIIHITGTKKYGNNKCKRSRC